MSGSVVLIDSDAHASAHVAGELRDQGFDPVERVGAGLAVRATVSRVQPDVVVFGYHFDRPDELLSCEVAKAAAPSARIVALATVGPAVRFLRQWSGQNACIDIVLERPLTEGHLGGTVRELAKAAQVERQLRVRTRRLASLVPEGAMGSIDATGDEGELFDAVVLFTDMRRSSELIARVSPREYFALLNRSLSEQSRVARLHHGQVVKYTGDGMMAVFRGMGRSHLAIRAAAALARSARREQAAFGVGLASGLVMSGLVGDSQAAGQRRQYDVIGSTAHLAARLCALAEPGEVVLPRTLLQASHLSLPATDRGPLRVRGFADAIECVALLDREQDDEPSLQPNPAFAGA